MELTVNRRNGSVVVMVTPGTGMIAGTQDALNLLADANYHYGSSNLLLPKQTLCEAFFDLSTGIAGEILQKYTNYGARVAVVGDFSGYSSRALRDFIRESNRGNQVFFLPTAEQALDALHGGGTAQ